MPDFVPSASAAFRRAVRPLLLAAPALLAGCASLPSAGPTARQVQRAEGSARQNPMQFRIVKLDPVAVRRIMDQDAAAAPATEPFLALARAGRVNTVGPGDVLGISIFEIGVTLFGGQAQFGEETFNPSARGQSLGGVVVGEDGAIRLPYIGSLPVAGKTPDEIEALIEGRLRGKSQSPQALVTVRQNVTNTVYVSGAVNRPGRFELTVARERLLDALAVSGGVNGPADSMVVRFTRGGRSVEQRLSDIRTGSPLDLPLLPGDRIELIQRPKSFSVFGATQRVSLVPFETDRLSLAEALARTGGPSEVQADPRGIFLFRFTADQTGAPIIYRLDLMEPTGYFLAQQIQVHDKDLIYVSNAPANLPTKFIGVINQLFSPFITARVLLDSNN